jgi:hypothetical protein
VTAESRATARVPAAEVFAVLADPWLYAAWVVGASHLRAADESWPTVGSTIHHSVGLWPAVVRDVSRVIACEQDQRLTLDVAVWFLGRGTVDLELRPDGPDRTTIVMREDMHSGVMSKLPDPVVDAVLRVRNNETLGRLVAVAERRTAPAE